ncbi:hypothetical protein LPJ71_000991 [Coemansia sp. S17]|nr:hypothetical protein LPJ71_000991 [Coemansia sp. S17]KAJ2432179.1 hypothetical protein GGF41_000150 [Coemansia sp. RSA 2531]
MLLSLLATVLALLAQLALGADDSDDSGKVAVNQIDLLGGTTGLVALTAALIQILPSPVQLCERRLQRFLDWLKSSIEDDFCVSLYTCTNKCHTQTYEPNSESMRHRILTSIGEADSVGCIGNEHLSVDELVTIIQTGSNVKTLLELAELARYPEMGKLRRAIRTVYYSPTNGRSVIVVQWTGFLFCGLAYWLVSTGIPPAWRQFWRVIFNFVRRIRRLTPIHGSAERAGLDYRMADLARHRTLFQHVPWIRYALYYMLSNMANRTLSARSWSIDENKADVDSQPTEPNESSPVFGHAMLGERRLVTRMATDECSAARLLYSNALHSLRVILLSEAVAYVPPYLLTSSFRMVRRKLAKTMLVVTHSDLDAVYRSLFGGVGSDHSPSAYMLGGNTGGDQVKNEAGGRTYAHAAYDLLLKRLQSKLGRQITSGCEIYVLLNLTMLPLHHRSTGSISAASSASSTERPQFEIEGVQIPDDLLRKLIIGRDTTGAFIFELLTLFKSTDIYWGSTIWLLYLLRTVYGAFSETDLTASDEETGKSTFMTIRTELKLLCFSPFQPRFGVPGSDIPDYVIGRQHDLHEPLGSWDVLSDIDYCNSVPAWCTCTGHCPGICTLIVNELDMNILVPRYFTTPYAFRMSFPRGPGPDAEFTALRLVCATNWDIQAEYALLTLKEYRDNTQQASGNQNARLDQTTFDLSDILYSKAAVVVVIHGGAIMVHKLNTDAAGGRWPLNLWCRPLVQRLLSGDRIIVPKVIALKLEPVDAFTEQVGKEITLSDSRLRYMTMQAAKTPRSLGIPFRSHGPMSKAA